MQAKASEQFVPSSFKSLGKKEGRIVGTDPNSKIEEAQLLKKEGNEQFKLKDYKKAISSYNKALMYVTGFVGKNDEYYQYGNQNTQLSEEQQKLVQEIKCSTFLNIAQIDIFNQNYQKCVERATKALQIQPSAKGYYRRGIANQEIKEFERARDDYSKCLELDPSLKNDIEKRLTVLAKAEKEADKKSASVYQKMFK